MTPPTRHIPHHSIIEQNLPTWTRHTSAEHWQRLRHAQQPPQGHAGLEADWFANAAPDLREAVLVAQACSRTSTAALAGKLRGLQSLTGFAEPLLAERLQADFGLRLEVRQVQWVDYEEVLFSPRQPPKAVAKAPICLVQAALHNFYANQAFLSPSHLRDAAQTRLAIAPAAFAAACRALDLGQRYQAHLLSQYRAPFVAQLWMTATQDRLRAAVQLARLRLDIRGETQERLLALLDGSAQLMPVQQPSLFAVALREVLLFHPQGLGDDQPVVLWLPAAPDGELVEYASLAECTAALQARLCKADFRQFFARFVSTAQQAHFFSVLKRNLDGGDAKADEDWPLQTGADLHLTTRTLANPHFRSLFEQHLQQALDDARLLAVPSADADAARHAQIKAFWESSALNFLNAAAFFVPGLGEVMMAVVAYQLVEEVVEGVQAWQIGDIDAAMEHMESVALNVAFIGGLAVAGKAAAQLSKLAEVRLADGRVRLWQPDLAPYRSAVELPADLSGNDLGQYLQGDKTYVRIDGHLHEQRFDTAQGQWRLVHPDDPGAYQPELVHNGHGAWRSVHERPLNWSAGQLLRRLGPLSEGLGDAELLAVLELSGTSEAQLRQALVGNAPPPPLLADTLARLQAARRAGSRARFAQSYTAQPPAAASSELPLVRALQGLYSPVLASADSDRLLLACVQRLPGWPEDLSLELRGGAVDGPLLERIGLRSAPRCTVVVKTLDGYQAPPEPSVDDLFEAAFNSLDSDAREALAVPDSTALMTKVRSLALQHRDQLSQWLWSYRRFAWPETGGLRGGSGRGYPQGSHALASLVARYRRLYPALTDAQAQRALDSWAGVNLNAAEQLGRLEQQFTGLQRDLAHWSAANEARQTLRDELLSVWQQERYRQLPDGSRVFQLNMDETGLNTDDLRSFPAIQASFAHVRELSLDDNPLDELPRAFSRHFPNLQRLSLSSTQLSSVPSSLGAQLRVMDLSDSALIWTPDDQAALQQYRNLEELQLSANPLETPPDLSALTRLRMLDLSHTQISALPPGLPGLQQAQLIDLSDNLLQRLPVGFVLPEPIARALRLENNPFDAVTLERIEQYFTAHQVDLMVADVNYDGLLFTATPEQRALWQRLQVHAPRPFVRHLRGLYGRLDYQTAPHATLRRWWRVMGWLEHAPANQTLMVPEIARNLLVLEPQAQSAFALAAPNPALRAERLLRQVLERVRLQAVQSAAEQTSTALILGDAAAAVNREPIQQAFFFWFLQQLGEDPTLVMAPTPLAGEPLSTELIEPYLQQQPGGWLEPLREHIEQLNPGTEAGLNAILQRYQGTRLFVHADWAALLRQRFAAQFIELESQYARTLELAEGMIEDPQHLQVYRQDLEQQFLQRLDALVRRLTRNIEVEPHEE
ncbi:leucine-rich repeat domain-containing protein [Pseudomonas sp. BIGb0427]|uniref:leucine-rich repeat domain-containing protein n=1 Tax=unclassified Pseudomonas TaxID=196821 RepID=UPI0018A7A4F6|nr:MULTISPECIES: leucine-rich repeat domain-containing protein [unclassified Pseudomonas]QPG61730.1 leucine-rich repeat domain-containing protein [Pseudomonas sp. BIGb0427]UVM69241.1 leucine-rich repeat domain-containing protein [Pseudomonas sp. B21-009]